MNANINGRKAVITNRLQRWSSFEALANQLGYPDAAVPSEQDKRTRPQDGDVVTVLSSVGKRGETVTRDNQRVFIVEAANGERHIYGEKGLRILDEEVTGVTVLKDESLGGAEREYREVRRKAAVGERIKIVDASEFSDYENGDTFIVERDDCDGDIFITDNVGDEEGVFAYEYVTLEPSDIVRINSARFRMVDRKAAVGERVIALEGCDRFYRAGDVGKYTNCGMADFNGNEYVYGDGIWAIGDDVGYRVLEPVESAETAPVSEPLSAKPAPDQAAEIIAKLTGRVASLERRVTLLEIANAKPIPRRVAQERPSVTVAEVTADLAQRAKESRQRKRDDIVKRAKEDLEGVKTPWNINADPKPLVYVFRQFVVDVEFIVNREKRTVVAIARWRATNAIVNKGIAKCAPGDVFNSHLGRAISLRRALGLEIPEEYVSAPQPTEVRVGDVVKWTNTYIPDDTEVLTLTEIEDERYWLSDGGFDNRETLTVLDDSREDSAEPRKEVA